MAEFKIRGTIWIRTEGRKMRYEYAVHTVQTRNAEAIMNEYAEAGYRLVSCTSTRTTDHASLVLTIVMERELGE